MDRINIVATILSMLMLVACSPRSHKVEFDENTGNLTCTSEYRVVEDGGFIVQERCKNDKLSVWTNLYTIYYTDKDSAISDAKRLSLNAKMPQCGYHCPPTEKQVWP